MSTEQFEKGDVVRFKSGGPAMTVIQIDSEGYLYCKWFEGSKVYDDSFPQYALMKLPESRGVQFDNE